MNRLSLLALFLMLIVAGSCVSRRKLTYLQYANGSALSEKSLNETNSSVATAIYKVMPFDNLYIRVITPDPQWSTVFNLDVGTAGITQESAALSGYTVHSEGWIEIPFVGKVMVSGKSITEIKTELDSIFMGFVDDAAITVKLVNNYVSILGEVNMPGRYLITKDRLNVFEALSLAGDMSEFSNRSKIQLIRPSQYGPIIKEFSLTDRSILSSEYYYVFPNDIIYAMPLKGKSFQVNSSVWTLLLSTITSALGVIAFFRTL